MHKFVRQIYAYSTAILVLFLSGCAALQPHIQIPLVAPPPKPINHPNVVLVLGGGGARGFAHVGVIKELEKNHVPIDLIIGTSAGSLVGALYADDPNAKDLEKTMALATRKNLIDISLAHPFIGAITGNDLQTFYLHHMHARTFDELKIPFIAVATNFKTGQPVQLRSGPIAPAVNASAAIPVAFRPVRMYGMTLVDGGVVDNVAADIARQYHPKLIIAVNINKPIEQKLPTNTFSIITRAFNLTSQRLTSQTSKQADIVLYPDVRQIGVFDDSPRAFLIEAGEKVADHAMPTIKAAMAQRGIPYRSSH